MQDNGRIEQIKKVLEYDMAVENCGSEEMFWDILKDFVKLIDTKSKLIEQLLEKKDITNYTVEVHGMKSNSRLIGLMGLSGLFYRLEHLGKENQVDTIIKETPIVINHFRSFKPVLEPFTKSPQDVTKIKVENDVLIDSFEKIKSAIDSFDLDTADAIAKQLDTYEMPNEILEKVEELQKYVADVAMDEILKITDEIISLIKK